MTQQTTMTARIEPKAVMSEAELAAWEAMPPEEQLVRLRAAIDKGMNSGVSSRTMDQILRSVLARHPNAKL